MSTLLVILALILGAALLLAGIWGQAIGKAGHLQTLPPGARVLLMASGGVLIFGGYTSAQALPRRAEVEPRVWIAQATTAVVAQDTAPVAAAPPAPAPEPAVVATPVDAVAPAPEPAVVATPVAAVTPVTSPTGAAIAAKPGPDCVPSAAARAAPAVAPKPAKVRARTLHIYDELGPGQWSERLLLTIDGKPVGELSPGPNAPLAKLEIAASGPVGYRLRGTTTLSSGARIAVDGAGTLDPREGTRYAVRLDQRRLWLEAE